MAHFRPKQNGAYFFAPDEKPRTKDKIVLKNNNPHTDLLMRVDRVSFDESLFRPNETSMFPTLTKQGGAPSIMKRPPEAPPSVTATMVKDGKKIKATLPAIKKEALEDLAVAISANEGMALPTDKTYQKRVGKRP